MVVIYFAISLTALLAIASKCAEPRYKFFNYYPVTELLISYSAGFVRRGLLGTLFYHGSSYGSLSLIRISSLIIFGGYIAIPLLFIRKFWRSCARIELAAILVSPLLIDFLISNANVMIFRKEYIFILCLLAYGLAVNRIRLRYFDILFWVIISPLTIFVHEAAILLVVPPALLIRHYSKVASSKLGLIVNSWFVYVVLIVPSIFSAIISFSYSGLGMQPETICISWLKVGADINCFLGPSSALWYVDPVKNIYWLHHLRQEVWSSDNIPTQIVATLAYCAFFAKCCARLVSSCFGEGCKYSLLIAKRSLALSSFCFLIALPLYFVALDYGRWLSYSAFLTILLHYLLIPSADYGKLSTHYNDPYGSLLQTDGPSSRKKSSVWLTICLMVNFWSPLMKVSAYPVFIRIANFKERGIHSWLGLILQLAIVFIVAIDVIQNSSTYPLSSSDSSTS